MASDFETALATAFPALLDACGEACSYTPYGAAAVSIEAIFQNRTVSREMDAAQRQTSRVATAQFDAADVTGLIEPSLFRDTITDGYSVTWLIVEITRKRGTIFSVKLQEYEGFAIGQTTQEVY